MRKRHSKISKDIYLEDTREWRGGFRWRGKEEVQKLDQCPDFLPSTQAEVRMCDPFYMHLPIHLCMAISREGAK